MNSTIRMALGSLVILALASFGTAQAAEQGFFIGGSVGQSTLKTTADDTELEFEEDFTFDENDTAWKILAGYNWKLGSNFNLALEGAYVNFGKPNTTVPALGDDVTAELEATGFTGFGLGSFSLGPVDIFGKLGFIAWDGDATLSDSDGNSETDNDSGTDFGYGVGGMFNLGSFGIRLEYERYEISEIDRADMWTVGATWTF